MAEILGLDLEETDARPAGAVVLVRIDSPVSGWDAHSDWVAACSPIAWAPDASYVLAHEVGHTLGLEHSSDPANLMYPAPGYELDDEQVDTLRLGAWRLLHECP
ncbi:MAG: matrixin family metalloprotease [Nannocystaceae bacterium]